MNLFNSNMFVIDPNIRQLVLAYPQIDLKGIMIATQVQNHHHHFRTHYISSTDLDNFARKCSPEEHHCSVLSWSSYPGGRGRLWRAATSTGLSFCDERPLTEAARRCSGWGWTCSRSPCRSPQTKPDASSASRCRGSGREPGPRLHLSGRERWNRGRGSCPSWRYVEKNCSNEEQQNNIRWNTKSINH